MATLQIHVPDIGDFDEVTVIEILVKAGDTVKAEQSLITVESDKASMEIPSSHAGVVTALKVKLGDKVKMGSLVAELESGAAAASNPAAVAPSNSAPTASPSAPAPSAAPSISSPMQTTASAATASAAIDIQVPDIGDFDEVTVIELLVKVGDTVKTEQSLITVESDKASMEIPSSHAGVVKEIKTKLGDKVKQGTVIAVIAGAAGVATSAAADAVSPASAAAVVAASTHSAADASVDAHNPSAQTAALASLPNASPSVRKYARELGVPLVEVKGSAPNNRITHEDVQAFTQAVMAGKKTTTAQAAEGVGSGAGGAKSGGVSLDLLPWPKVDFTKFGAVERKDLSRIKKISGANLHRNWVMIPHVTNNDQADITDLEALRVKLNKENEKSGIKVTMLAFMIKACVAALKKFPEFNASLDGDQLVFKQYFHVGFAADTPNGLVVPVIRDADKKGILQIAKEMGELATKARDGKLGPADMTGGCFSISSLGGIGGTHFTPIINAPELAILGASKSTMQPVWDGKAFVPRLILPLSLSYDHRVIDGAAAARFNAFLCTILADFRRAAL